MHVCPNLSHRLLCSNVLFWGSVLAILVCVEQDTCAFTLSTFVAFDPLARLHDSVQALQESQGTATGVGAVVGTHDLLNSFSSLVCVIEGDCANVVVQDVGFDDTVEDVRTNGPEVAVDGCRSTTSEVPGLGTVVRKGWIGVLEESNGD